MFEEAPIRDTMMLIVMCVGPLLVFWVVVKDFQKLKKEHVGLFDQEIPFFAIIPTAARFFALSILFFLLLIGLTHVPF